MKNLIIRFFIAGFLALPVQVFAEDFKPSSNIVTLMPLVIDNLDLLNVTAEQRNAFRTIARKNFKEVEYINAQYNNLKNELKEELLDYKANETHSLTLLKELAMLDQKRMLLTINCANGLKKVLSQAQYEELISLLEFQS